MNRHVILGVTGSIAAYKAADIARLLMKGGSDVSVIMTESATHFVGELTFRTLTRRPVGLDMFAPKDDWKPEHISLAERADSLLIAPCTANVIAKLANGIADDLLTCTALACVAPVIVAPAMNEKMWEHPATQANIAVLKERGVTILEVGSGDLACGYQGKGRMADPEEIVAMVLGLPGSMETDHE